MCAGACPVACMLSYVGSVVESGSAHMEYMSRSWLERYVGAVLEQVYLIDRTYLKLFDLNLVPNLEPQKCTFGWMCYGCRKWQSL
jgi:hypothetical protein